MMHLILFGGLRIARPGESAPISSVRSRLISLAVIALAGEHGVRRERLTSLLWPDSDDERARTALRQALFVIRKEVGEADLVVGSAELRLNPEVITADAARFLEALEANRLEAAVALYTGPFLDGVVIRDNADLERWVDEQRRVLAAAYAKALERLAEQATSRGEREAAVRWWEKAAAHDRLSARVARGYMDALARAGETAAAVRHADIYGETVRTLLEVEPDPAIAAHAAALSAVPAPGSQQPTSRQTPTASSVPVAPATSPAIAEPHVAVERAPAPSTSHRRSRAWLIAAVAMAGVVGLGVQRWRSADSPTAPAAISTVALAPLEVDSLDRARLLPLVEQIQTALHAHLMTTGVRVVERSALTGAPGDAVVYGRVKATASGMLTFFEVRRVTDGRMLLSTSRFFDATAPADSAIAELQQIVSGAVAVLADSVYFPWALGTSRPPRYNALLAFRQFADLNAHFARPDEMRPHLDRAVALDPDFAQARIYQIDVADAMGESQSVIDSLLSEAVARRDRFGGFDQLFLDREIAYLSARWEDEFAATQQMLRLAPRSIDAHFHHIHATLATRRFAETITTYHRLQSLGGSLSQMVQLRGFDLQAHRLLKDYDRAVQELATERAAKHYADPICDEGLRLLATLGREAAIDSLVEECRLAGAAGGNVGMKHVIAGRQLKRGGFDAASVRAYRRALALPQMRTRAGLIHAELGEWHEAVARLREPATPQGPDVQLARAIATAHIGDSSEAAAFLARPLPEPKPRLVRGTTHLQRAFVFAALGRRDGALSELQRATDFGVSTVFNGWQVRWELRPLWGDPRFEAMIAPRN